MNNITVYDAKIVYTPVREIQVSSVRSPAEIVDYLRDAFAQYPNQEQVYIVTLDGGNNPTSRILITLGLVNQTQCHPREVFRPAIQASAVSIILAHNHPSGSIVASNEDLKMTREIANCGEMLGIPVLDHLIVTQTNWKSIKSSHPGLFP